MNGVSPWALSSSAELATKEETLYEFAVSNFNFKLYNTHDSIWISALSPTGSQISFRAVFSPGAFLKITKISERTNGVDLKLVSDVAKLQCTINVEPGDTPILRYTTSLQPEKDLFIPFWPKDMLATGKNGRLTNAEGKIHASQWGTRSGFIYMTLPAPNALSVFYLQNLTALNDYCQQTQTSLADSVGGNWPELGFSLPAATVAPLPAGKRFIINDAIIAFDEQIPQKESEMIRQYLNLLSKIYLLLPLPETKYQNWPEILHLSLRDLLDSPGCWTQVAGHQYFNAYVSDYQTPPEVMVQLAVLLPLVDYKEWSGKTLSVMKTIKDGLPAFYDQKLGTINRWLPASEEELQGEEEQKKPGVMDSWYLHHPLLNLSRLALKGDKVCEELFLNSIKYAIRVAHHFNYEWPVFYKMDTLEVIKAETAEGKGGEKDVAGIYAHVMLQAWELTHEQRYLNEAEKSARTLKGKGFQLFYQANNTAFSAGALLRLYKITKKEIYLELSYMCLASIFRNTKLWDCNYGYGKNFPSFFALYPLNDAPYTAVYEEQEVFCAFHDYLRHADDVDILPAVRLLIAEYIRHLVNRAMFYYPVMLPKEMLEEKPKVGEVDPKLWIALEDLQDGWLKSGTVGQEVYGAGNAFGILPRHYLSVPDEEFMVYVDYPTSNFKARKGSNIHFKVLGDERLTCRMMILKTENTKLPQFIVRTQNAEELVPTTLKDGNLEYQLNGNQEIVIAWKH